MPELRLSLRGVLSLAAIILMAMVIPRGYAVVQAISSPAAGIRSQTGTDGITPADEWATCSGGVAHPASISYMAEGCTAPGYETWILISNTNKNVSRVTATFLTSSGEEKSIRLVMDRRSRATINVGEHVPNNADVSTIIKSTDPIVCERAMYASNRDWAHCNTGAIRAATSWYVAEGCTAPGYETWLLILNPDNQSADITTELQTEKGAVPGPVDTIPPRSRRSYNLADYVQSYNVSCVVSSKSRIVCERATYSPDRDWATCSGGVIECSREWYLVEGCTAPGYDTWLLVQNPGSGPVDIKTELQTDNGTVEGPAETIPPKTRRSYNLADYAVTYDVSARIKSDGWVVCERSMYSSDRDWATSNTGLTETSGAWYFAEGCTAYGFNTWILIQNPGDENGVVFLFCQPATTGYIQIDPQYSLDPGIRESINVKDCFGNKTAMALRTSSDPEICAERAMYGKSTNAMATPTVGTPLYPFTTDESIACGHWPPGSTDYPYFGAPRNNTRIHAGIDIYPPGGAGAPVYAIKAGTVVKVEPFYTRYTGEVAYAMLIDHGDFVVNYGEVKPPALKAGDRVERGQLIGYISGTSQLHLEMYTPGTTNWLQWYGPQPVNLIDPTGIMVDLYDMSQ